MATASGAAGADASRARGAIVELVTDLELSGPADATALTERECRQREAADPADRYSVDVAGTRRWPDVVVEDADGRRALEIEFAPKGTARLRQIVGANERSRYIEARFLVKDAALGRRIASVVNGPSSMQQMMKLHHCPVTVVPWTGLASEHQSKLASRLAS